MPMLYSALTPLGVAVRPCPVASATGPLYSFMCHTPVKPLHVSVAATLLEYEELP